MLNLEELKAKTVFELKSYAKKNNIDLKDAKTKIEMLDVLQGKEIIVLSKPKEPTKKVAIYSDHNKYSVNKQKGSLKVGYNIVSKEAADWWLSRKGVREATPEEIARYYGVE